MDDHDGSEFVHHEECNSCGSSDANSLYSDGHTHCFSCGHHVKADGGTTDTTSVKRKRPSELIEYEQFDKAIRGITPETMAKFRYGHSTLSGKKVHVANFVDKHGTPCAQHIRTKDKKFPWLGNQKEALLFGQHLWRDGGRMLVITEGEIDAMSVSQIQGNKYPVVAITGTDKAKVDISRQLEWIEKFDTVIFMFDMDEVGQKAARKCALVLSPGKAKIASLPLKDANEMLQAKRGPEVIDAIWSAKEYRPEGLVTIADLRDEVMKPIEVGLDWWCPKLTELTYGRRTGEIYTFGAGTGVGKTDFLTQQVVNDITVLRQKVGLFFFEQQPVETVKRVAGKLAGKPFHIPSPGPRALTDEDIAKGYTYGQQVPGSWAEEDLIDALNKLDAEGQGKLYMFDHFGTASWEIVEKRIRYLAHAEDVKIFYIDHLTALAAAEDNEREGLEQIMSDMGGLVKELDIMIHLVSHLSTPEGKPHEEGGRVMIRHFKGSRSIGFWSHYMFGLERDQQAEEEEVKTTTTVRVLKDRYTGQATGSTFYLGFDPEAARLFEKDYFGDTGDDDDDIPF